MLVKFTAILLKKIKYGEKNLILQTYTREAGSRTMFLGGSQGSKKKAKVSLPSLCMLEIVADSGKGELFRVKEIQLKNAHYNLLSDLTKASIIMFLNEVLIKTIKDYQPDEELFDFISESIANLDEIVVGNPNFHLKFLMDFSKHLGFYPSGQHSSMNEFFDLYEGQFIPDHPIHKAAIKPELAALFGQLLLCEASESGLLALTNSQRKALLSHIIDYYKIHLDNFDELKSKEILETVLA